MHFNFYDFQKIDFNKMYANGFNHFDTIDRKHDTFKNCIPFDCVTPAIVKKMTTQNVEYVIEIIVDKQGVMIDIDSNINDTCFLFKSKKHLKNHGLLAFFVSDLFTCNDIKKLINTQTFKRLFDEVDHLEKRVK